MADVGDQLSENSDQLAVDRDQGRQDAGGTGEEQLSEVRGQSSEVGELAAEGEIGALKAAHAAEILALTEQVEALRDAVKAQLSAAPQADDAEGPAKTSGVKESRHSGPRHVLAAAASQAGQTGSRGDVQEYLRLRRQYV